MKPLADLTVVEAGQVVSAPFAGMLFADMGADVIKVERPETGDSQRHVTPGSHSIGDFEFLNRGKRSLELDLRDEAGQAVFKDLLADADIFIENLSPGAFDRLGMSLESLAESYEDLVMLSLKGFGSGPYEDRLGVDHPIEAETGMSYMTGLEDNPLRVGFSIVDITSATYLTLGALTVQRNLPLPPEDRVVTVGMFETAALLMGQSISYAAIEGEAPAPLNENIFKWAVYDYFDTADDEVVFFGLVSDAQWKRFASAFDMEDILEDPEMQNEAGRVEHREQIQTRVRDAIGSMSQDEVLSRLDNIRVPYAPLQTPADLLDDPHLAGEGKLVSVTRESGEEIPLPAPPMESPFFEYGDNVGTPGLGEHSAEVLHEIGYDDDDIEKLFDDDAVGTTADN